MSNLQNIIASFKIQDELNSKVWEKTTKNENYKMRPKVRERLLEIAYEFIEFVKVDFIVSDVVMTGSLANYNWSKYSDIDLHIMADFSQFKQNEKELYQELFTLKKTLFNDKHDIKIFGYDTELYIQDESEEHTSTGVYSVLFDDWIIEPSKEKIEVDRETVKNKAENWMKEIDTILDNIKDEPVEIAKNILKKIKDKIKKYRKSGLEEKGEFSIENLVFKVLRRNNYIQKIFDFENNYIDKTLSMNEAVLGSPLETMKVSSEFGVSRKTGKHPGTDLSTVSGSEVMAPADGEVIEAEFKPGACGGTLFLNHPNGLKTRYCHIKEFRVNKGDVVKQGQVVGLSGGGVSDKGAGNSQGPHLHFEVYKDGKLVDPMDYIDDLGQIKSSGDGKLDTKLNDATKSNFLENLKKIAKSTDEFKNLKTKGQKIPYNQSVEYIQTALQFLGFSLPKWGVDGLFGPETEKATKSFQEDYSLDSTGVFKQKDLQTLYAALIVSGFKESDLSSIQKKSDFSKINVEEDKSFYENLLKNIGVPITDENLKFLYAWRQSEGGKATNNPFNTTFKLSKDTNLSNYNSVGVKNYSKPEYGIEATVKTLLNGRYSCIVDGLRDDIGAENISKCESLKTWGTGDLVTKVLNAGKINPPEIYTV